MTFVARDFIGNLLSLLIISLGFTPVGGVSDSNSDMRKSYHEYVNPDRMGAFMEELFENGYAPNPGISESAMETGFKLMKYWQQRCDQVEVASVSLIT